MEESLPTLHITEKYIVLVAVVRLLKDGSHNTEEVEKILKLPVFKEEPFYYTRLYASLIEAVIDDKALEFINSFLHDVESESMYYDDGIEADFRELKDYCSNIYFLIHKMEEQLMRNVYLTRSDTYDSHKEKAMDFMHKNKILNEIRVYKDESGLINQSIMFLDVGSIRFNQSTDEMDRFSFHL